MIILQNEMILKFNFENHLYNRIPIVIDLQWNFPFHNCLKKLKLFGNRFEIIDNFPVLDACRIASFPLLILLSFSYSIYAEFNDFLFSLFGKLKLFLSLTNSKDKPIKLDPKTYNLHLLNTKSLFVRHSIIISTQSSKFILCFMLLLKKKVLVSISFFLFCYLFSLLCFLLLFCLTNKNSIFSCTIFMLIEKIL